MKKNHNIDFIYIILLFYFITRKKKGEKKFGKYLETLFE